MTEILSPVSAATSPFVLASMEMTETASVTFTLLEHYGPRVVPGDQIHPIPEHLDGLLADTIVGDYTYTNTVRQNGWQSAVRMALDNYLTYDETGLELRAGLDVKSLDYLSPEQAVKLSAAFVLDVSRYTYADVDAPGRTAADYATVPELLWQGMLCKNDPDWQGSGVCRNIASGVKAVFESLKHAQAEPSMLRNTYAVFSTGRKGVNAAESGQSGFDFSEHAWNTFVTLEANGSAVATVVDATGALAVSSETPDDTAIRRLARTRVKVAEEIIQLYTRSARKPEAIAGLREYMGSLIGSSMADSRLTPEARERIRKYAMAANSRLVENVL